MVIDNKFEIGQMVYLKTEEEQLPRIITCIIVDMGSVMYELINCTTTSCHYEFELSLERNQILNL